MFLCWNLTMSQLSQEGFVNHHLLKSMVNKNMKWRMFLIHEYQMTNFNTLDITAGMT